ncbi:hypothetical protein ALP72_200086 [Pseudomonas coronafaciens pv. coronafaciens]|nr:hypothetical protein ALP72_200086 [Pseudomonas coronafaciens pv. coronafaciens]
MADRVAKVCDRLLAQEYGVNARDPAFREHIHHVNPFALTLGTGLLLSPDQHTTCTRFAKDEPHRCLGRAYCLRGGLAVAHRGTGAELFLLLRGIKRQRCTSDSAPRTALRKANGCPNYHLGDFLDRSCHYSILQATSGAHSMRQTPSSATDQ